jgi:hypothetical protein
MPFQATVTFTCWKEHTCAYCGARYRYPLKRTSTGQGLTEEMAREAVSQIVLDSMQNEVVPVACPGCGHYQPEMSAASKLPLLVVLLLLALGVGLLELILPLVGTVADHTVIYVLGGLAVAIVLTAWLFGLGNLNRNPEANRVRAQQVVQEGRLQFTPPSSPPAEPPAFQGRLRHAFAGLLLLAGALLPFAAEGLRHREGWALNAAWSPQVVGPGDYCWTRFPPSGLQSVKGHWRAKVVSARALNAREAGLRSEMLRAESNQQSWGTSIAVKAGEKSQSFAPWCGVYVPDQGQLAGKRLTVRMDLILEYPDLVAGNQFTDRTRETWHTEDLLLSSPEAGATYRRVWCAGGVVGLGLIAVVLGYYIARLNRIKALALPTDVFPANPEP